MDRGFPAHEEIITWQAPPMKFGIGATREIGDELGRAGLHSVLLVADPHLSRLGAVRQLVKLVEHEGIAVEVYDRVQVEPTDTGCAQAAVELAELDVDGYVAFGGGSTIDTAKMLNLLGTFPGSAVSDYLNTPVGAGAAVPGPLKPLVAIPTTAGSGSECTAMVALGITGLGIKTGISDLALRPSLALVDPMNTLTLPPEVTASSGYDVLTHACESYTARPYDRRAPYASPADRPLYIGANPISDIWAEQALTLVGRFLRRAVLNGHDIEARIAMSQAASFAAMGFGNAGTHIPHACAYPVAGRVRDYTPPGYGSDHPLVPHGSAVVSTAAAAFTFTYPTAPERHLRAAELLGANLDGVTLGNGADVLPATLRSIVADTGGPQGVGAFGYTRQDLPALVEGALQQRRLLVCCPREAAAEDLHRILDASLAG
jgi:hydroxyacid-oxoacid transhydrogenase